MLFSVLMANYNNSKYLDAAITSVIAQTYSQWELILVDDSSTDNFEEVVGRFSHEPRIRIFRNEFNAGCGFTKRKCAGQATGALLGFLDPDDTLDPEALDIMVKAHRQHPSASLIHSTHYICDEKLSVRRVAPYPRPLPAGIPYLLLNDGSIHSFATFKKSHYDRTEGISPLNKRAVDQDLFYKMEETGEIVFIDRPLYYYRIHGNSISNSGNENKATLCHYSIIEEACLRRIRNEKESAPAGIGTRSMGKKYRTKYYKTRVFHCFRERLWLRFIANFFMFSATGGMSNLVSYVKKLPVEGISLLKRSFIDAYEIKP